MSFKIAIVVALAVAQTINCLPFGVPPQACQTMSPAGPAHAGGLQNSPLPYDTVLSATNIKSTGSIVLTVKSKTTDKISGIMVQARDINSDQPIGTFQVNDPKLKTIGCTAQDVSTSINRSEIYTILILTKFFRVRLR